MQKQKNWTGRDGGSGPLRALHLDFSNWFYPSGNSGGAERWEHASIPAASRWVGKTRASLVSPYHGAYDSEEEDKLYLPHVKAFETPPAFVELDEGKGAIFSSVRDSFLIIAERKASSREMGRANEAELWAGQVERSSQVLLTFEPISII